MTMNGVRMAEPAELRDQCSCDEGRLAAILQNFSAQEIDGLREADGKLHANCQFCARTYALDPAQFAK